MATKDQLRRNPASRPDLDAMLKEGIDSARKGKVIHTPDNLPDDPSHGGTTETKYNKKKRK